MHTTSRLIAILLAVVALLCLPAAMPDAHAQSPAASPVAPGTTDPASQPKPAPKSFLPPKAAATATQPPTPPSGILARFYAWVAFQQRAFSQSMAASLREIKRGDALNASLLLMGLSFLYGVLHAAGPGHGKAIVASYMLTDGQTVRRGIQLAFLSSFIQALAAIALYLIVVLVLRGARTEIVATETLLERVSWAIVAAFGAWLLWRQLRAMSGGAPAHVHTYHEHHHHGHGHDHHGHRYADPHRHHDHAHDHHHTSGETCETCGHSHMPAPAELQGAWSWKRALTLALGVGIRPCTGAIGVLFVASGLGLMWAGIASTIVMSIGTAITVSALAALAVSSRDLATRFAGATDNAFAARAQTAFGLAGAALVFLLGATFLYYSMTTTAPV